MLPVALDVLRPVGGERRAGALSGVDLDVFLARLATRQAGVAGDRARDAMLQAHGYTVVRFTWRQVMHETLLVTVRIAQLLSRTPHSAPTTPPAGG